MLYVRVDISPKLFKKSIAVVGSRKMTNYGREVTEILVRDLVSAGFTIISGLAYVWIHTRIELPSGMGARL